MKTKLTDLEKSPLILFPRSYKEINLQLKGCK